MEETTRDDSLRLRSGSRDCWLNGVEAKADGHIWILLAQLIRPRLLTKRLGDT
jgi:hypothetical protein